MTRSIDRRRFVQLSAGGLAVGLAGCLGGDDDDDENGDDDDGNGGESDSDEGLAYAFAPNQISIIDPAEGDVVDEITDGIDDYSWGDPRITTDLSQIFVIEDSQDQVVVIDTESREITAEVGIGPDATHMYHPNDDEMWAHSDENGAFYVVETDSPEEGDVRVVESGLDDEGHGKLLYHEDFGSTGYATNVNDPGAPVIDLEDYERSEFIDFTESDEIDAEEGTHYKAYSPETGLAYFEYGDETVVVDTETNDIVDVLDLAGGMYLTPDEQLLGVLDGDDIRFLDATSEDSEELGSVTVEGGPDALRYYDDDGTIYAFTANTMNDEGAVIDTDEFEVLETLSVGDIERPEGARHLHRSGVAGDEYFLTPADGDGFVAVIDMAEQEVAHQVDVEDGVDTIQYVGDSGVGYSGKIR